MKYCFFIFVILFFSIPSIGNNGMDDGKKVVTGSFGGQGVPAGGQEVKPVVKPVLKNKLEIESVELNFSNGKYYQVVSKKGSPPDYILKIKVKGHGLIKGVWLVDGEIIGQFSKIPLENTTISFSGKDLPELPLINLGIHEFTFDFLNYRFLGDIPVLKYFVTNRRAISIIFPKSGESVRKGKSIRLLWAKEANTSEYIVSVSKTPFRFLKENQVKWGKTGNRNSFDLDLKTFDSVNWIYWQVRALNSSGSSINSSEIYNFKILNAQK